MKYRICAVLLALCILLGACGSDSSAGQVLRYDIPSEVHNLDPQFATDETARMIIGNVFEGLFRQLPDGRVVPCLAESYDVSPDGLTYTIRLKAGRKWADKAETPLTAHDFAFAISRMFDSTAFSPFAANFSSIRNASAILAGAVPRDALGVKALDDYTLQISLIRPDNQLPELLSTSYAMPCNQTYFENTRARYGLDKNNLLSNGPFYVRNWNNQSVISLRLNTHYVSEEPPVAAGVDFYPPARQTEKDASSSDGATKPVNPLTRFMAGETDACKVPYEALNAVKTAGGTPVSFEDTVWVLVLNQRLGWAANADIRRAFAYAIDRSMLTGEYLPGNLRTASVLVPPAVSMLGEPFRASAAAEFPLPYSPELAKRALSSGLQALGISRLPLDEILVTADNNQTLLTGFVQQNLQKYLSVSAGVTALSKADLLARVTAGDFQAAILPLSAAYSSPEAIYSFFRSDSGQNFSACRLPELDRLLTGAAAMSGEDRLSAYQEAENLLLTECAAIPLYFETSYYAMGKGVSEIDFSPFLSSMGFRNARKK